MNVAVTRAKRQCCIIGDSETLKNDEFLKNLVQYFRDNGEYISAAQFQGNNDYDIPITIAYTNEPKIESEQIIEKVNQISEKGRERENSWYQRILDFISSGNSSRKTPYIPKDMISKMEDKCKELKVFYTIDRKGDQTAFIFFLKKNLNLNK